MRVGTLQRGMLAAWLIAAAAAQLAANVRELKQRAAAAQFELLRAEPEYAQRSLYYLEQCYRKLKNGSSTRSAFAALLERYPDSPLLHKLLGTAYDPAGRLEGALAEFLRAAQMDPQLPEKGIQAGAVSFVDEGTSKVLDILQDRAAINTLFLPTFTYGRGIAGRQVPGQPFPDHGKQRYDLDFHGGNHGAVHARYYTETGVKPEAGIPTADRNSKSTPQGTKNAVVAAFRAGARGVLLSRKYSEMRLANLSAAGEAIQELKLA